MINSVSVHWTLALKSPNQRSDSTTMIAGATAPRISQVNLPSMRKPMPIFRASFHRTDCELRNAHCDSSEAVSSILRVSRFRDSRFLQSILLQPPVKRASTQTERLRRLARVPIVSSQRLLDQKRLDFFEAHVFQALRFTAASR